MRFIKYLSLEVVLGAILYQCFLFEVYFHSLPPVVEVSLFALVVWFLYFGCLAMGGFPRLLPRLEHLV